MKPHVLLAGGTGYIGKSLIKELRDATTLHTISQYPKSQSHADTTVIKGDIYHYADVLRAMEGMDIAVYFLDPTKHSAKLTRALAKDLNLIAADNFGRAAAKQQVKEIIYVRGSQFDEETVKQLGAYGVPIRTTEHVVKRPHISVEFQTSKYNDIRIAHHIPRPQTWNLAQWIQQLRIWLTITPGTRVTVEQEGQQFKVYRKNSQQLWMQLELEMIDKDLYRLVMTKGRLARLNQDKCMQIEFRYIRQFDFVIAHVFNFIPSALWPIAYFVQVPLIQMMLRGFDTKCRIRHFQYRKQNGEDLRYTKD
ncbi:NAD(P)H-binding protein [Staphylococcus pseudintermedius]|uniref:NAD(P)H-binding protein n=1 Tax=Staphylococcus pseudintermedius TaxID=283734 RepID=UPI0028FD2BE4|nr:NAD(P)H-binding protein [Staphylococcus pseudintermedius]MDU0383610.1 NAD(P)H-binding protein [Staphylococcus pseudintermedius]